MGEGFDPYYKWLGIAPEEQPPHHYRLLSIRTFEEDADVISNAADRQMAHVRTFQGGKNSELSQKLLNEIAAAKVCLLDAERKRAYDERLRTTVEPVGAPRAQEVPVARAIQGKPRAKPAGRRRPQNDVVQISAGDVAGSYKQRLPQRPLFPLLACGLLTVGGVTILAALLSGGGPSKGSVADENATNSTRPKRESRGNSAAVRRSGDDPRETDVRPSRGQVERTPAPGPEGPPQVRRSGGDTANDDAAIEGVLQAIRQSVSKGTTIDTPLVGGTIRKNSFRDVHPEGGLLIGVKVSTGKFGFGYRFRAVASIQPIYLTPQGIAYADTHGPVKANVKEILAKDGYAVGAIKVEVSPHPRVHGIQLIFMKIERTGLNPKDQYASDVYLQVSDAAKILDSGGRPIVGVQGSWAVQEMRGMGLVLAQ